MPKPNLFNYATKELSQDAIICWLIEWAGTQAENESEQQLRKVGHAFVDALLTKHGVVLTGSVRCTEIHQQNLGIDVLARGVYGNPHAEAAEISLAVCEGTKWSKIDIAFYVFFAGNGRNLASGPRAALVNHNWKCTVPDRRYKNA